MDKQNLKIIKRKHVYSGLLLFFSTLVLVSFQNCGKLNTQQIEQISQSSKIGPNPSVASNLCDAACMEIIFSD